MTTIPVLALTAGVYLLRSSELRELELRAAALKKTVPPGTALPAGKGGAFDPRPLLAALRSCGKEREAMIAIQAELAKLSSSELEQLIFAAQAEAATAPQLLIGIAAFVILPAEGARRVPDCLTPFLAELPMKEPGTGYVFRGTLICWLEQNPAAASRWLKEALAAGKLQDCPGKKDLPLFRALGAMRAAPLQELANIRNFPDNRQDSLLEAGAGSVSTPEDIRAFTAAVIAWPSAGAKRRPLETLMEKLLENGGFSSASAWLDALPDATAEQKNEARIVLALRDPDTSQISSHAAWAVSSAGAAARPAVAGGLTEAWVLRDHDAAGAWLNTNRTAPWYDAAAGAFANGVAAKEPASAFDWMLTISDERHRRSVLKSVMNRWQKDNAAAALEYLEKSSLPSDWKTEFTGIVAP
jgi:hypothetical protein